MPLPIEIQAPVPASDLAVHHLEVREALSELGEMSLGLLSAQPDLKPEAFLGQPVTVTLHTQLEGKRHFSGYVTRFGLGRHQGRRFGYQATVRPWLWFLTRTSDCRIFQDQSVPDIVKTVFEDHGIAKFDFKLFRSYAKRTYCVQYRESDFDFIARLLEHEGIYWYIAHEDGHHTMVLVDAQSAHDPAPGCESLHFHASPQGLPPGTEYIDSWHFEREVQSGRVVQTSYDFEKPSTSLLVQARLAREHELADLEQFDFQGDYTAKADGQQWTDDRLEELQDAHDLLRGQGNAQGVTAGCLLKLEGHPRPDQNRELLVVGTQLSVQLQSFESAGPGTAPEPGRARCSFTAIPSQQQFRPARRTRRPIVQGPQTAMVVGPAGEEIYTDKHGRVKVQFHWDRYGQRNEKSSCWMRVSTPWAGKGWGGVSVPRIGQEVVVSFLEGDPDQPLITGRVYNAEQVPPFELPAGAVVSGVKTKTHKGEGYNEMSMDDTAGQEKITIHGQYDMNTTVLHDQTSTVNNNRTDKVGVDDKESIGSNQTLEVGANQTLSVGGSRSKTVTGSETTTVQGHRSETVNGGEDVTVNGGRSHTVNGMQTTTISLLKTETIGAAYLLTVGAAMNHAVGAALIQEVGAAKMVNVGAISSENVAISKSVNAGSNISHAAGAAFSQSAGADFANKAGGAYSGRAGGTMSFSSGADFSVNSSAKVAIVAASELTLKCGSAEIVLKSGGEISIKGTDIILKASGSIKGTASGAMDLKGSAINMN